MKPNCSEVPNRVGTGTKAGGLDTHMLENSDKDIRQGRIVFCVKCQMPLVSKATTGQQHWQIGVVM